MCKRKCTNVEVYFNRHQIFYVTLAATRNESKLLKETEVELQVRLKTLQNDLADSRREKQFLQTTIDRIQKEKQQLIIDTTRKADKSTKVKGKICKCDINVISMC